MDALTTERYAGKRPARHFKGLKAGKRQACALTTEAMCRQTAGCNAGTAEADGYRAWWKLPRGSCREAPYRHGRPNKRELCRQTAGEAF